MKISMNWIKEFVDLDGISTEELIKRFNLATAEIEGYEEKGKEIKDVITARIEKISKHPNSDRLQIMQLNVGKPELVQVLTTATNIYEGMVTAFVQVGGQVCGQKIGKATMGGEDSFGMGCSESDLGIGSDDAGLWDIKEDVPLGVDIKQLWPVDDVVFEIDNKTLTNRPDLWGHYGIAREFAAIFGRKLKDIQTLDLTKFEGLKKLHVKNNSEHCFRYGALAAHNVTVKKSPIWMALKLNYCGMRDINLLADITNYIMLELGQPMHAFDHDVVSGIEVVEAKKGDKLLTLEGEEHEIPEGSIVIADDKKVPVAIAGIKGGLKASISDTTTNVLFESATFEAPVIRKTSRAIGLVTDASQRYEKSLDPELTEIAMGRILKVLSEIDKNIVVSSSFTDVYSIKYPKITVEITAEFISRRIGVELQKSQIESILKSLGFKVSSRGETIVAEVPSYRATKDVSMKEDLVEEVARMYGYDNITEQPLAFNPIPTELNPAVKQEYDVKKLLAEKYDANEIHSYIWNYSDFNKSHFIASEPVVSLMDSSNAGQSGIRKDLLPTLLKVLDENKNTNSEFRIFEIGRVAANINQENLVNEEKRLAVVFASQSASCEDLFAKLNQFIVDYAKNNLLIDIELKEGDKPAFMHPVNTFRVTSREGDYGYIGVLHPKTANLIDKRLKIVALE
ncbi:MAG: phenylalanine--tRNA ligase subunit beta, partial [Clostridia bacterium]|nr:phenylalanine--tRNA ligase subunit beta [Clostridia bacterium]